MAFQLKLNESMSDGIRRIVKRRHDRVAHGLDDETVMTLDPLR